MKIKAFRFDLGTNILTWEGGQNIKPRPGESTRVQRDGTKESVVGWNES